MNYAIYFILAFIGCFMALMIFVLFLSFFADRLLEEKKDKNEDEIDSWS